MGMMAGEGVKVGFGSGGAACVRRGVMRTLLVDFE